MQGFPWQLVFDRLEPAEQEFYNLRLVCRAAWKASNHSVDHWLILLSELKPDRVGYLCWKCEVTRPPWHQGDQCFRSDCEGEYRVVLRKNMLKTVPVNLQVLECGLRKKRRRLEIAASNDFDSMEAYARMARDYAVRYQKSLRELEVLDVDLMLFPTRKPKKARIDLNNSKLRLNKSRDE